MEDERGEDDVNFTPRHNPRRQATRNVNYTSKNYALIGLNSEEADKLWEIDNRFLSTVGVEGQGFGTSPADKSMIKDSYVSIDGTQEIIHPCAYSVKV